MKNFVLLAALFATPSLASAQECETYETGDFTVRTCSISEPTDCTRDRWNPVSKEMENVSCAEAEIVAFQPVYLNCKQDSTDAEAGIIHCSHGVGLARGEITVNLCFWDEAGNKTCGRNFKEQIGQPG